MDSQELDDRIDRLSIRKQLQILLKTLAEARSKVELSNLLWQRIVAAEDLLNTEEAKLFDSAVDTLIDVRQMVGCRRKKRREK